MGMMFAEASDSGSRVYQDLHQGTIQQSRFGAEHCEFRLQRTKGGYLMSLEVKGSS